MILVIVEHADGRVSKSTLELITAARLSGIEGPLAALILGESIDAIATEMATYVEQVLVANRPDLAAYDLKCGLLPSRRLRRKVKRSLY